MKEVKALYTQAEVAELLGRPKQTISRWVKDGSLPTVVIGTQKLIPLAGLKTPAIVWRSILLAAKANGADKLLSA